MADVVTAWNPFIITNKGLDLRQAAIATGKSVKFDYAKIGQGAPSNPANIPLMTDVVQSAHKVPVVRSESNGVTHFVGVRIDNKEFPQPVLMREIGLFASLDGGTPILYGYTYATQGYDSIPAGSISHYIWTVGIDTVLSRAQSITFNYDGSTVYASFDDIDQLMQSWETYKDEAGIDELHGSVEQHSADIKELQKNAEYVATIKAFAVSGEMLCHLLNIGYIDGDGGSATVTVPMQTAQLQGETLNLNPYSFEPYNSTHDGARLVLFDGYASISDETLTLK